MKIVWSYGGGTQSIAIACLIKQGRLPRPDRVVMADTGYEFKKTWQYTEQHVAPLLAEMNLTIEIAPHTLATVDLYSLKGEILLPAYDATKVNAKGEHAKLPTLCSTEWKTRVVRRYIGGAAGNPDGVVMWLGMSLDELGRVKPSGLDWCCNAWPLIGWPAQYRYGVTMTRAECRDLITTFGLEEPIKSRCKMCPNQDDNGWLEVQQEPEEWREAIEIDEQIFASHGVRLHRSGLPLSMVQFKRDSSANEGCDSGMCFV